MRDCEGLGDKELSGSSCYGQPKEGNFNLRRVKGLVDVRKSDF